MNNAGWAYDTPPQRPVNPEFILYGPVITMAWDPLYIGATIGD